jgi:hypothetical protein
MILKIRKNTAPDPIADKVFPSMIRTYRWWIYGDIYRIDHSYILDGDAEQLRIENEKDYDLLLFGRDVIKDNKTLYIEFRSICLPTTLGIIKILLQDCVCYLCNDEGKTVDKLVC